ncbi:cell division protein FtsQ/DivIB [Marinimicrobium sp. ABcell2]|uniref:cell division protein FtsQ/DivIB n=1 Tax=Marinimicrobium sp. ABcell2 TaxID=3069751 RepID=UPI0027B11084|nr:FtsQ-type POTRA domain-containing protein [Marinimicrobium sp. ABcell2]MDQ2075090.1 FtsQ-type POTRA domain-containing protein [Marinimicrobium sp. ABcell2]
MKQGVKRIPGQRGVSPRGATQKAGPRKLPEGFKRWSLRALWCSLLVAMVVLGYRFGAEPVAQVFDRPIAKVQVEGAFRYADKEELEQLIAAALNDNFLKLDLANVRAELERNPWVERAAVQRQWPDTLRVRIYEQHPIARWGNKGFLNRRGDIIQVPELDKVSHLPWLDGDDDDAVKVMRYYLEVGELLRARGLALRSLKCDKRKSWEMRVGDGIKVTIGRDAMMDKVQRFLTVYDQTLHEHWKEVASVDLRYHSGIAVGWVEEQDSNEG